MSRPRIDQSDMSLKLLLAGSLILFALFSRVLPHPANFTPIAAVAIFGGALLPRRWALTLPLAAMVGSDLIIGLHPLVLLTWGSFALIAWTSNAYLKQPRPLHIGLASVAGSVLFYLVTNFGVWLEGRMYTMDLSGLLTSYYQALPFFRNTLVGDLVYTGLLFGAFALVHKLAGGTQQATAAS